MAEGQNVTEGKGKGGRPSKYKPEMLQEAVKYASIGLSYKDIGYLLSRPGEYTITEDDIKNWVRYYPEFNTSLKAAKVKGKATMIKCLFDAANKGSIAAIVFWLGNRAPDEWKNIQKYEHEIKEIPPMMLRPAGAKEEKKESTPPEEKTDATG